MAAFYTNQPCIHGEGGSSSGRLYVKAVCHGVGACVGSLALVASGSTVAVGDEGNPADAALEVIEEVAPEVLSSTALLDVAVGEVADTGGVEVLVPADATDGISLEGSAGAGLTIGLPFADEARTLEGDGTVVYDNGNGSSSVPLVKAGGVVQVITTIDNGAAPHAYSYSLDLAEGAKVVLTTGGGAEVIEADGSVRTTVAAPWAYDANGQPVPTHYEVDGTTLTQIVEFADNAAFPIVADPKFTVTWWNKTLYFNKKETAVVATGLGSAGTIATWFGIPAALITGRVLQGYAIASGIYRANGACGKLVNYLHVSAPVPQQYSGSEAGGYCK